MEIVRGALSEARFGRPASAPPPAPISHGIIGRSVQIRAILSRIEKVATSNVNVCIYGENGTGKEMIARAIHYASRRRDRPLITLDCTTIPEGLVESHLFGHVKGAFTSASEDRDGMFSLAHTGTLFVDELCELSLPLQAKLLRVVQSREFFRVGGSRTIRTDVRLITATNKDLEAAVAARTLREDLYYRVAVSVIRVPPLRERREDIPLLVDHFLEKFSAKHARPMPRVAPSALKRLTDLPWPGNVRQLENCLEQAVVLAEGELLTERDLLTEDRPNPGTDVAAAAPAPTLSGHFEAGLLLKEVERRHILRTLLKVHGKRTEAARLLGISVRGLQHKLKSSSTS